MLELLNQQFGNVLVPPAVALELAHPPSAFVPLDLEKLTNFRIQAPVDLARVSQIEESLDRGESQAIVLAMEVNASYLLIDEADGRAMAARLRISTTGTLGILLRGKEMGRIAKIEPLLDALEEGLRFFIDSGLRQRVLKKAGER